MAFWRECCRLSLLLAPCCCCRLLCDLVPLQWRRPILLACLPAASLSVCAYAAVVLSHSSQRSCTHPLFRFTSYIGAFGFGYNMLLAVGLCGMWLGWAISATIHKCQPF